MRSLTLSLALLCLTAIPARADDLANSTTLGFESRYVFRGLQNAETSLQPSITLTKSGFHAGAWFNLPVGDDDNFVPAYGEELDLVVGYSNALSSLVSYDAGLTIYTYPKASSGLFDFYKRNNGTGAATLEPYFTVNFSLPLAPAASVFHDFSLHTTTLQGGFSQSTPLTGKTSFDVGGFIGYVFADSPGADYLYGAANANISYQFSEKSSIYVGARYGGSNISGGAIVKDSIARTLKPSGFWWGIGFSASL